MTIAREEPGVVTAICEGCGDRRVLDDEPFGADDRAVNAQLATLGWKRNKPDRVSFDVSSAYGKMTISYDQDFCPDCQTAEPKPHPRFLSCRVARLAVAPLANDPVDEWPRAKVWEALGLNPMCGHPGTYPCSWCDFDYPIGRTDARARR